MNSESCPCCGYEQKDAPLTLCPECGEMIAGNVCCYGGITGTDDDGFPVFCEECLVGLTLALDWLVQRMAVYGRALEYAPTGALWIPATEGSLTALIAEHDRVLSLYEQKDGYNARINPEGKKVEAIRYWPQFRELAAMGEA